MTAGSDSKASWAKRSSPAPKTCEWLARICSVSVVPDRGRPTMKIGRSVSSPKPRTRSKNVGRTGRHQARDEPRMVRRVVVLALGAPVGQPQGVGLPQVLGGLVVGALGIEHEGQAEVQGRALAPGQVGVGHQLPHGGQVGLGQLAAEQGRQLSIERRRGSDRAAAPRGDGARPPRSR